MKNPKENIKSLKERFIVDNEIDGWILFKNELEEELRNVVEKGIKVIVSNGFPVKVIDDNNFLSEKERIELLNLTERYLYILDKIDLLTK